MSEMGQQQTPLFQEVILTAPSVGSCIKPAAPSEAKGIAVDGSRRNAAPACEKRQSAVRSRLMVNSTRPLGSSCECSTALM